MNDEKLKQLLKQHSYTPGHNEWFTPRLLNRLPRQQRSMRWINTITLVAAVVACGVAWDWFLTNNNFLVITVRDIINTLTLMAVTATVAWHVLKTIVHTDE